LNGNTENDESRQWAGELAKNSEGVVAVVNQIEVAPTTFKSTMRNFTSNPNRREDFIVGIGYDDSIPSGLRGQWIPLAHR
jgi:hypothetical protein